MKTGSDKRRLLVLGIAAVNALGAGFAAAATDLNAEVGAGLEYHSNAARTAADEESDVASVARAALTWIDSDGPLLADATYAVNHRDYQDDVEDDRTAVDGRASLQWQALPRRLDVIAQHQISETQSDLRTADVPSNRERRSVLTGGFNGYLALSGVDTIVLSPRYTDIKFSESEQSDSERASLGVNWVHALDAVSRVTLGGSYADVSFDDEAQDYKSQSVQLGYATALARLRYSLSGGVTRFDRDTLDDVDGHIVQAEISYRGDNFEVGSHFVSELTDSSIGLSASEFSLTDFNANDAQFRQVDVIERTQLDVFWNQTLSPTSAIDLRVGATKDDYEEQPLDEERAFAEAGYRYTINAFFNVGARARYERFDFSDDPLGRKYDDTTLTLSAQYRVTQDFDVRLSLSQVDRSADEAVDEYTDNVALLTLNYRLF